MWMTKNLTPDPSPPEADQDDIEIMWRKVWSSVKIISIENRRQGIVENLSIRL